LRRASHLLSPIDGLHFIVSPVTVGNVLGPVFGFEDGWQGESCQFAPRLSGAGAAAWSGFPLRAARQVDMRKSRRDLVGSFHHGLPATPEPGSEVMNRREFLQAGTTSSGLVLSGAGGFAPAAAFPAPERKRVGLIGTGWYGKINLLRLLQVAPVDVVS